MSLKLLLESLDDVPEALHGEYAKGDDGKFRLNVDGLEDTTALKNAAKKEREARGELEKKLKAFEGIDPEEARSLLERFEKDEDLKLLKSGDINTLRERWTEKMRADHVKQLEAAKAETKAEAAKGKLMRDYVLDNRVREAAAKAGVSPHAIEDALLRARSIFSLTDDNQAVQIKDGGIVVGKEGTPYSPSEWLDTMREMAPHWFPAQPGGSGSQQTNHNNASNGSGRIMKRAAFDQLDHAERAKVARSGVRIID